MGKDLVRFEGVGLQLGGRWRLREVDFAIGQGEIVTLIGPNGGGKTSAAKLALDILQPDAGQIIRRENLRCGYVPQTLTMDWSLPVSVRRFLSLTSSTNTQQQNSALEEVGVPHLSEMPMHLLSPGEVQRVMLARAFLRKPDLLVLDEPGRGVDFAGEQALYGLISNWRDKQGCGVLLISHDLHLVMAAATQVICLNGHICCAGAPQTVAKHPEYQALFGKSGLTLYQHAHDHTHAPGTPELEPHP